MKKKLSIALAITAIAPFGLIACGDDDDESSDDSAATTEETTDDDDTGSSGGGSTVAFTAAEDGSLAFEEDSAETEAGTVTVELDNPSSLRMTSRSRARTAMSVAPTRSQATRRRPTSSSSPATTPSTAPSPATARPAWRATSRSSRPIARSSAGEGAADRLGDAHGLFLALALERELRDGLIPAAVELIDGDELGGSADARARRARAPGSGPCSSPCSRRASRPRP